MASAAAAAFQLADLFDPPGVPAPFELGLDPDLDHAVDQSLAEHVGGKAEDVKIIVPAAHLGRQVVVARGGSNSPKLVRGDAHADAGSADQNPAVDLPGTDFLRNH